MNKAQLIKRNNTAGEHNDGYRLGDDQRRTRRQPGKGASAIYLRLERNIAEASQATLDPRIVSIMRLVLPGPAWWQ